MEPALVAVIGSLFGVVIGIVGQEFRAWRNRKSQIEDRDLQHQFERDRLIIQETRHVYAELLRAVSASYVQAVTGQRTRSEDHNLRAAAAEIQLLAEQDLGERVQAFVEEVIERHSQIAVDPDLAQTVADAANPRRIELIDLFKADLERRGSIGRYAQLDRNA